MRSDRLRSFVLLGLAGASAGLWGCDVYDPAFLNRLDGGPGFDGGPDAGRDASREDGGDEDAGDVDAGPPACPIRRWPGRPTTEGGGMELVFALRDPIADQTESPNLWSDIGYDLDGQCTDDPGDEHLCVPPGLSAPPLDGVASDGGRGVDNVLGRNMFPAIAMVQPDFAADAAAGMARGDTFLVRIRNWNGEDDDNSVEAAFGQSIGSSGLLREDMQTTAQWDGLDEWSLSNENFAAGNPNSPTIIDRAAYIAGRVLVFRLPDRETLYLPWTSTFSLPLRLTDARIIGRISEDGSRLENVAFIGRWAKTDFDAATETVGICDPSQRIALNIAVSNNLDLLSAPDTGGAGVLCDAMSLAIGFTGYRALWGPVVEPPMRPDNRCD